MIGQDFSLDYSLQRHAELLRAAERERLIRCLEAAHRAERAQAAERGRRPWHKRSLAAAGGVLVWIGNRLQQAAQVTAAS